VLYCFSHASSPSADFFKEHFQPAVSWMSEGTPDTQGWL
jgi:hypothetical protein